MSEIIAVLMAIWNGIPLLVKALGGLIAFFMVIPGPEPERTLQKIVDFISKFSIGPKGSK